MRNTPEKMYDLRVVKRNIAQGKISEKDYSKQLKTLPDLEGEYDVVDLSDPKEEEEEVQAEPAAENEASA